MQNFLKTILPKSYIVKKLSEPKKRVEIPIIRKSDLTAFISFVLFSFTMFALVSIVEPRVATLAITTFVVSLCFPGSLFLFLIDKEFVSHIDVIKELFKNSNVSSDAYWQLNHLLKRPKFSNLSPETLAKIRVLTFEYWYDILSKAPSWQVIHDEKVLTELLEPLANQIKELIDEDQQKLEQTRKCLVKTIKAERVQ